MAARTGPANWRRRSPYIQDMPHGISISVRAKFACRELRAVMSRWAKRVQATNFAKPAKFIPCPRFAALAWFAGASAFAASTIPVKVVVVTMFELGADTGDQPGEFQYWVEREGLDRIIPFPAGNRALRMNRQGVLGMVTGVGTAKAAASVMALGLDPRFDLRKAYWVVAGIAGIDPADGSLGSAAWAEWVVDGDMGHEIDAREIPPDWKTGYVPLRKSKPYELPRRVPNEGESYHLNPGLVEWAYRLTRNVELPDSDAMRRRREQYPEPNARKPPFVLKGDTLSSMTFWHGKL